MSWPVNATSGCGGGPGRGRVQSGERVLRNTGGLRTGHGPKTLTLSHGLRLGSCSGCPRYRELGVPPKKGGALSSRRLRNTPTLRAPAAEEATLLRFTDQILLFLCREGGGRETLVWAECCCCCASGGGGEGSCALRAGSVR